MRNSIRHMVSEVDTTRLTAFLAGDVMIGRAIDQIQQHPGASNLHEPYVDDARVYVELAERVSGRIPCPVSPDYIWGDALEELEIRSPRIRLVNLETSITRSTRYWLGKKIHYRMNPSNIGCLEILQPDCCVLANNHMLDWGIEGLRETLSVLRDSGIRCCGAGVDRLSALQPVALPLNPGGENAGKLLIFAFGVDSSGIPATWAAAEGQPGLCYLDAATPRTAQQVSHLIEQYKGPLDRVIVSLHWGGNWGYEIADDQIGFAHSLIDSGAADVLYGHSSHHPIGIEIYRGKLILYGCGDLINDYEGITARPPHRSDLSLMYWIDLNTPTGCLMDLRMTPLRIRKFRLERASEEEARQLNDELIEASSVFGSDFELEFEPNLNIRLTN